MSISVRPKSDEMVTLPLPDRSNLENSTALIHGLGSNDMMKKLMTPHPLEHSEKMWEENQYRKNLEMLRNTQGLYAPMRLQMEQHTAKKMHRLPGGIPSSNAMLDTLTGRDTTIDFEDILNNPYDKEELGSTHAIMEKRLGLL